MATTDTQGLRSSSLGASGSSAAQAKDKTNLGKDEFVKLLMAQLSAQDPTSPADSTQFVAQLAQFAQVELMTNTADRLDSLLLAQTASNQTLAAGLAGKDVMFRTESVQLGATGDASLSADLSAPARNVTWTITDKDGKVVRTIRQADLEAGSVSASWDGRDDRGRRLPAGEYKIRVAADDGSGNAVAVTSRAQGHVDGVAFDKGYAELMVGGRRVPMGQVLQVTDPVRPPIT